MGRASARRMWPGRGLARSGRQTGAALVPTGLDDRPAGSCRHPVPEPVLHGPLPVVRLERSLHPLPPLPSRTAGRVCVRRGPRHAVRPGLEFKDTAQVGHGQKGSAPRRDRPGRRPTLESRIRPPLDTVMFAGSVKIPLRQRRIMVLRCSNRTLPPRLPSTSSGPRPPGVSTDDDEWRRFSTGVDVIVDEPSAGREASS